MSRVRFCDRYVFLTHDEAVVIRDALGRYGFQPALYLGRKVRVDGVLLNSWKDV